MKTSELTGAALDWAVAKCEGFQVELNPQHGDWKQSGWWQCGPYAWQPLCGYSINWAQGGPIIERECINLTYRHPNFTGLWTAFNDEWDDDKNGVNCGDTPLIAAMRCYVASKLGDEVDIPEVLNG